MLVQLIILFLSALSGGLIASLLPRLNRNAFQLMLVFAGGYLFALTLLDVLPLLYGYYEGSRAVGVYILVGFLLQIVLEYFSQGVEHGHLHEAQLNTGHHQHKKITPITLLITLCIHALLDGIILTKPIGSHVHHSHHAHSLLVGIVLHKAPAAFALVSILLKLLKSRMKIAVYCLLFALASPIGLVGSTYLNENQLLSPKGAMILWCIAGGSFLHISTTIFFEASPNHELNSRKLLISSLGIGLAIIVAYIA